jgi:hypothetical protein
MEILDCAENREEKWRGKHSVGYKLINIRE